MAKESRPGFTSVKKSRKKMLPTIKDATDCLWIPDLHRRHLGTLQSSTKYIETFLKLIPPSSKFQC